MGDAHHLHHSSSSISSQYSQHVGSTWDLEIFNTGLSLVTTRESRCMRGSSPSPPITYYGGSTTTGYLEDALHHYTTRSAKRPRRPSLLYHQIPNNLYNIDYNRWWGVDDNNLSCITQSMFTASISDEVGIVKSSRSSEEECCGGGGASGVKLFQKAVVTTKLASSSSASGDSSSGSRMRKRSKVIKGLVYPFQVVKPGGIGIGIGDDATLKDINERILMPPTRPLPHPVGDYASFPRPYYAPGLSGNPVLSLTTIHTQARRGTITIITTTT